MIEKNIDDQEALHEENTLITFWQQDLNGHYQCSKPIFETSLMARSINEELQID